MNNKIIYCVLQYDGEIEACDWEIVECFEDKIMAEWFTWKKNNNHNKDQYEKYYIEETTLKNTIAPKEVKELLEERKKIKERLIIVDKVLKNGVKEKKKND